MPLDFPNIFTYIVLAALVLHFGIESWLRRRQLRYVAAHQKSVPADFADRISLSDHQRAADYTQAKGRLEGWEALVGLLFAIVMLLGGLAKLWAVCARFFDAGSLLSEVALLALFSLISGIVSLPFNYYGTFGIESKFGFNKSTPSLFWGDLIKGALLGAALMLPLAAFVFWLMRSAGPLWWLWAWCAFFGFQLLLLSLYPTFIAPLFNKFTPLADGDTKTSIEGLLKRTGFASKGLFIMDGSKRSAHGNAYFTGFGKGKRIVFFDTLLERLSDNEIVAVLAHELGHFKRRHIVKRLVFMAFASLAFLAAAAWALKKPWLYSAFGFSPDTGTQSPGVALILFAMVLPPLLFWLSPLSAFVSRKHEFEADAFAATTTDKTALISALTKLYKDNASTLTPDPVYSAYHHSHPPAMIRIAHLKSL